ncbi:MAG TPA: PAC2 family protein, partial [Alphaproteobacteria bacterium]|nr:PAC2 family protein [Alphaproteobacteria bacterium]
MDKKINVKHMNGWEVYEHSSPKITSPVMICGMPGIGNVGKICIDILIEGTKAVLIKSFHSKHLPNSVFVNEENLIDLPKLSLYYKKINNKDFLFLTGDVQPVDEQSSYDFTELVIQIFKEYKGDHILTTGGIGLSVVPEHP